MATEVRKGDLTLLKAPSYSYFYSTDNLFALDLGSLDKGWKELSFMLSKRCYIATVNYHSKYFVFEVF